jgi:dipeptidyl aminopeptidase/acylaminoacyl peptidase
VHHVRAGVPPTMIFHGTEDTTVPFENVERFQKRMHAHGNRCELIPYEGKGHGFFNYARDRAIYDDTIRRADSFLRELGYLAE